MKDKIDIWKYITYCKRQKKKGKKVETNKAGKVYHFQVIKCALITLTH